MKTTLETPKGWELHGLEATPHTAAKRAISLMGGARKVAAQFGISPQAVYNWRQVPGTKVLAIEQETGVSRHELRPDLFGERV